MNDYSDTIATTARAVPGYVYLPKAIYEAIPTAYVSMGSLFILGAAYIGFSHWTMIGYLAMGLTCVFGGVNIYRIRHKARSAR